jgi:hypothetical protein
LSRCRIPLGEVWEPQIVLFNRLEFGRQLAEVVHVDKEGNVYYLQRFQGFLRSPFNLRDFPLDRQVLPITLFSIEHGPDSVNLQFDTTAPSHTHELHLAGWNVVGESHHVGTLETRSADPSAENEHFVRFDYEFQVRRALEYYIWRVIGPLTFIVLMSWAVFWIDPGNFGVQIGLAATSILTLIAFLFSLNAILPPLPYLTRMDFFLFISLALVFVSFAEAVATAVLSASNREGLALRTDRWARWVFPGLFAVVHLVVWTWP